MTQTTFTDNVEIQGSRDIKQLNVKGNATQTQPLETWQNNAGDTLSEVNATGDVKVGDLALLDPTRDALLEAHRDSNSTRPKRGLHSLGRITSAVGDVISWMVAELELLGTVSVTGLQTAFRAKLTHNNTGDPSNAEFRAGDFQTINQKGTSGARVKQVTGVRGTASNAASAYATKAVGVEATITNDANGNLTDASAFEVATPINTAPGVIANLYGLRISDLNQGTKNYALYSGLGTVHVGDDQELKIFASPPTANPPAGYIKMYPKLQGGAPQLYAKDESGVETQLGGSGGSIPPGALMPFAGIINGNPGGTGSTPYPPTGWLLCNGDAVSRSTYSALFNAISTTYGTGDGSTTFNLPDLRGRAAIGAGQGSGLTNRPLGQQVGTETQALTTSQLPSHTHTIPASTGSSGSPDVAWKITNQQTSLTSGSTGSGSAHNNMQPSLPLNYIIKI